MKQILQSIWVLLREGRTIIILLQEIRDAAHLILCRLDGHITPEMQAKINAIVRIAEANRKKEQEAIDRLTPGNTTGKGVK